MARPRQINASDFKAKCLGILDEVKESGAEMVITKRGKPVARLVPIGSQRASMRGAWKGSARVRGDIVHVDWTSEFKAAR